MAAQMRACHCRACLRTANTLARRPLPTSPAGYPRRRKFVASDVFTACYTAIMATAAVVDARQKDKRRRELDRQLAEAKSSLAAMLEASHARDLARVVASASPDATCEPPLDKNEVLKAICNLSPTFVETLRSRRRTKVEMLEGLRWRLGIVWAAECWEVSSLPICEQIVAAETENPPVGAREPKTERHLDRTIAMINHLVDRLQEEAYWQTESEAPGSHPSLDSPDSARTMIRLLRSEGYPSHTHPEVNREEAVTVRRRLNTAIMGIFDQWIPYRREQLVAKICYNLLICGIPPGIQNYNALILGFAQLGEHRLAQAVVDSFLYKSHLKPTEGTLLCLLHHYRLKRDVVGFWLLLRRLFGYHPLGIKLGRRSKEDVDQHVILQHWAATADVNLVGGYYVLRAALSQNVAEAIMEGLLDFGMIRAAANILAIFLQEKWDLSSAPIRRLFHACLSGLDREALYRVAHAFVSNIDQATSWILDMKRSSYNMARQLHHILNLCLVQSLPQMDGSLSPTPVFPKARLDRLVTAIWIREQRAHCVMMAQTLKRITQLLCKEKRRPLYARVVQAITLFDRAVQFPVRKLEKAERFQRIAPILWLEVQSAMSLRAIGLAENAVYDTSLAKQALDATETWTRSGPDDPVETELALVGAGTLQRLVAMCWYRSRQIDAQLKAALLEALPPELAESLGVAQGDSVSPSLKRVMNSVEKYLEKLRSDAAVAAALREDPFQRLLEQITAWDRAQALQAAASKPSW